MGVLDTLSSAMYGDRHAKVNDLLSDISLNNRFSIRLSNPVGLTGLFDIEKDSFRADMANIPNSTIDVDTLMYSGKQRDVAKFRKNDTLNVTFIDNSKGVLRKKFFVWQRYIFDKSYGKLAYYKEYIANELQINIHGFESLSDFSTIHFEEVYPSIVGDIQYVRGEAEMVKFQVSFTFKDMYYSETKTSADYDGLNTFNIIKKISDVGSSLSSAFKFN